jgi:hypothetical protein
MSLKTNKELSQAILGLAKASFDGSGDWKGFQFQLFVAFAGFKSWELVRKAVEGTVVHPTTPLPAPRAEPEANAQAGDATGAKQPDKESQDSASESKEPAGSKPASVLTETELNELNSEEVKHEALLVYKAIVQCLRSQALRFVQNVPIGDLLTLWQKLCDRYGRRTFVTKGILKTQLEGLKKETRESILELTNRLHEISRELEGYGVVTEEDDKIRYLLNALPH